MILQIAKRVPQYLVSRLRPTSRIQSGIDIIDERLNPIKDELVRSGYGRGIKVTAILSGDCHAEAIITNEVAEKGIACLIAAALEVSPDMIHTRAIVIDHFRTANFYIGKPEGMNDPVLMLRGL
ncbi:MAG: hypothetical protein WCV91_03030 [Candidatus Margulisiibacteriota bacterium]|jgi:hypothetical protein